jgi:hypothetical protein
MASKSMHVKTTILPHMPNPPQEDLSHLTVTSKPLLKVGGKSVEVKFYIMEGLPRSFLLGFPWMARYGGVVDARKGTLTVEDLDLIIPLQKTKGCNG